MDPESVRPILEEFSREIRRHFDVAVESLRSDNRLLAEGIALNSEQIAGLRSDVQDLNGRVTRVEIRLDHVDMRLDRVETRLDRVETRLDSVETQVGQLSGQVRELRAQTSAGLSSIKSELVGFDRRIDRLEKAS